MGTKATSTSCPNCGRRIELKLPYLCKMCGYSMIERRCIDCRRNIVVPLTRKKESVAVVFGTSTRVKLLLDMRELGLIDLRGDLSPKGRELVEKAGEQQF